MAGALFLGLMAKMPKGAAFLDTSVQIARFFKGADLKDRIERHLAQYLITTTGLVVRQEFKRRVMLEARYLLSVLEEEKSFSGMHWRVQRLPRQSRRKQVICTELLSTIIEIAEGKADSDLAKRAGLFLRSLLRTGMNEFDETVTHVIEKSKCGCGMRSIIKKPNGAYDFGPQDCQSAASSCEIAEFLRQKLPLLRQISTHLKGLQDKSDEIKRIEGFIDSCLANDDAKSHSPCLKVGDLLVALESDGIPTFYTMNGRESQHLCRILKQTMVIRRLSPAHDEEVYRPGEAWPHF